MTRATQPTIPDADTSTPASHFWSRLCAAADAAKLEAASAASLYPSFHSAHEGFAVLLEEVDELKAHVWTRQGKRDVKAMRREAIQVAAMALRFVVDCAETEEAGQR